MEAQIEIKEGIDALHESMPLIGEYYGRESKLLERVMTALLGRMIDGEDIRRLDLRKVFRFSEGTNRYDLLVNVAGHDVRLGAVVRSVDLELGIINIRFDVADEARRYFEDVGHIYGELGSDAEDSIRINRLLDGVKSGDLIVYRKEKNYDFRAHFNRWINNVEIEIILSNGMKNIVPAEDWEIDKESLPLKSV